jgi:hypothetical protein
MYSADLSNAFSTSSKRACGHSSLKQIPCYIPRVIDLTVIIEGPTLRQRGDAHDVRGSS